jgi:hypothetical protein
MAENHANIFFVCENKTRYTSSCINMELLFWLRCHINQQLGRGYRVRTTFANGDEQLADRKVLAEYHGPACSLADILRDPLSRHPLTLTNGIHPLGLAPLGKK